MLSFNLSVTYQNMGELKRAIKWGRIMLRESIRCEELKKESFELWGITYDPIKSLYKN